MSVTPSSSKPAISRRLARVIQLPPPARGQFGPDHTVVPVIAGDEFARTDPFILLMDDLVDGLPEVGPHPHAGFETVTLIVEGGMSHDGGRIGIGDVQWMTAGSGVIHGEAPEKAGRARILQLWLTLPKSRRWAAPGYQDLTYDQLPVRREAGVEVRLYSGSSGTVRSSTLNHVPVTFAEVRLEPRASVLQDLPSSYNGFFYVLEGEVRIGADRTALKPGQVGWLDRPEVEGDSVVRIEASGDESARVLLYAGQPQNDPIVSHGPFIGDTREDILRVTREFRAGLYGPPPRKDADHH